MRERNYFTKSSTFDVDYLLGKLKDESRKKPTTNKFDNEAIFDINKLLEK